MGQSDNWREKYLNALDEQERLEKLAAAQGDILRRVVVNLSAAAAGLDIELDDALVVLRDKLRGAKGTVVHDQVGYLETVVGGFEERRSKQFNELGYRLRELLSDLQYLCIPSSLGNQIENLSRTLNRQPPSYLSLPEQLHTIVNLQRQAIRSAQRPAQTLWQRIRGGAQLEPVEQLQKLEASNANIGPLRDPVEELEPPWTQVSSDIQLVLQAIFDGLTDSERSNEHWHRARLRLGESMAWELLLDTLKDLRLILDGRDSGLDQAISTYLTQVNQELHEICEQLGLSSLRHDRGQQAAHFLGQAVSNQMAHMQSSLDSATDLDGLKLDINQQISLIHQAMEAFQQHQAEVRPLSEELQVLIDKVKAIESESERTHAQLVEERHRAQHDALTELPNREAYNHRVQLEWLRYKRYGRELSLAVVDIDHFKRLNDQYGHRIGDRILRLVAQSLAKRLRTVDFIARYGGEEFVVLLPETSLDDAFQVMDSARKSFSGHSFRFKTQPVTITFSCGVSSFREKDSVGEVFERADKALYHAKRLGRNQTCRELV